MPPCALDKERIKEAVRFHGHWCPGLALGIRAAELALDKVGPDGDEDVVAMVETDMCGVDAIQFFTHCTFGKGNLIHYDHGKAVFTFIRRSDNEAWRISLKNRPAPDETEPAEDPRAAMAQAIMDADLEELFDAVKVKAAPPAKAAIRASITCDECGEQTMETRIRLAGDRRLCIPCFQKTTSRGGHLSTDKAD